MPSGFRSRGISSCHLSWAAFAGGFWCQTWLRRHLWFYIFICGQPLKSCRFFSCPLDNSVDVKSALMKLFPFPQEIFSVNTFLSFPYWFYLQCLLPSLIFRALRLLLWVPVSKCFAGLPFFFFPWCTVHFFQELRRVCYFCVSQAVSVGYQTGWTNKRYGIFLHGYSRGAEAKRKLNDASLVKIRRKWEGDTWEALGSDCVFLCCWLCGFKN